jgi:hypothetical protein
MPFKRTTYNTWPLLQSNTRRIASFYLNVWRCQWRRKAEFFGRKSNVIKTKRGVDMVRVGGKRGLFSPIGIGRKYHRWSRSSGRMGGTPSTTIVFLFSYFFPPYCLGFEGRWGWALFFDAAARSQANDVQRRAKGEEGTAEEAGLGTGVELSRTGVKRGKKTWMVVQSTAAITLKLVDLSAPSIAPIRSKRVVPSASVAHAVNLRGDLNAKISPFSSFEYGRIDAQHASFVYRLPVPR